MGMLEGLSTHCFSALALQNLRVKRRHLLLQKQNLAWQDRLGGDQGCQVERATEQFAVQADRGDRALGGCDQ